MDSAFDGRNCEANAAFMSRSLQGRGGIWRYSARRPVEIQAGSSAIGHLDGAFGLAVRNDEAFAGQPRICLHLGPGLEQQPLHGGRREKSIDQRAASKRISPEIAEMNLDVGQTATAEQAQGSRACSTPMKRQAGRARARRYSRGAGGR